MGKDDDAATNSRRTFIVQAGIVAGSSLLAPLQASAKDGPVVVLGAGGKTGMEVVQALVAQGLPAVSTTRTGKNPFELAKMVPDDVKSKITHFPDPVDVLSGDSLHQVMANIKPAGVIYCASASKNGGSAAQVDGQGVALAAQAAQDAGARFVLISALAVSRPESQSFQMTNTLGGNFQGIMDAKLEGEKQVRSIMSKSKDYVIVRPGVLMKGAKTVGPAGLEINQGDFIGGGLSRDELAGVAVGALVSGKKGVTVEVYRTATHTRIEKDFPKQSGNEMYGDTYSGLFSSVQSD